MIPKDDTITHNDRCRFENYINITIIDLFLCVILKKISLLFFIFPLHQYTSVEIGVQTVIVPYTETV